MSQEKKENLISFFHNNSQEHLLENIKYIFSIIKKTMSTGSTVMIVDNKEIVSYDDSRQILLKMQEYYLREKKTETAAVNLLCYATKEMVNHAGDGTTTICILIYSFFKEAYKLIQQQNNPRVICNVIDFIMNKLPIFLKENTQKITCQQEELLWIARVSTNGNELLSQTIYKLIQKLMGKTSKPEHLVINISKSKNQETYFEVQEGIFIGSKPHETQEETFSDTVILAIDGNLTYSNLLTLTQYVMQNNNKNLLCIGSSFSQECFNFSRDISQAKVCNVMLLEHNDREIIEDIALGSKGKLMRNFTNSNFMEYLGKTNRVIVEKNHTLFLNDEINDDLKKRYEELEGKIAEDPTNEQLCNRYAYLNNGIGNLYIGSQEDISYKELYEKVCDVRASCIAALSHGIVIGGGVEYVQFYGFLMEHIEELSINEQKILKTLLNCLLEPLRSIIENHVHHEDSHILIEKIKNESKQNMGYSVVHNKIMNLKEAQIFNPSYVMYKAIAIALSLTKMFISTSSLFYLL